MKTYLRKLTANEVTFEISAGFDHTEVRGNALASGDEKADKEAEDEIISRLEADDYWAWANVTVKAKWRGYSGSDNLGACSYADEDDFRSGPYFADMCSQALEDLNATLSHHEHELGALRFTSKGKISQIARKGYSLHKESKRYVKAGYTLAPCHGEAHSNAHIDHCMVCLDFVWGWTLEKLPE